jgi:hypothetical protein
MEQDGYEQAPDTSGRPSRRAPRAPGPLTAAGKKRANRRLVSGGKPRICPQRTR